MRSQYRALSIKQPWAGLIAAGKKTLEIRSWKTNYRGEVLLLAGKGFDACEWLPLTAPFLDVRRFVGERPPLPRGCAVALATLGNCRLMNRNDEDRALCPYSEGLFAWELFNVRPTRPVPISGMLGLMLLTLDEPVPLL